MFYLPHMDVYFNLPILKMDVYFNLHILKMINIYL